MAFTVAAVAVLLSVASGAFGAAAQWPAGVAPAACPNYPNCDPFIDPRTGHNIIALQQLAAAARAQAPAPAPAPAPVFYNYPYPYQAAYAADPAAAPADLYPAGVSAAECPNYPLCHDGNGNGNFAAGTSKSEIVGVPAVAPRQYPAGVNPATCPNYPYCF